MRPLQLVVLSLLVFGCDANIFASSNDDRSASTIMIEKEILAIQASRFAAMIEADAEELDKVLADDLVYTHTTGRSESKQVFLQSLTSDSISYDSITPIDVLVRTYDDTAVVTGQAVFKVRAGDDRFEFGIRFIEVYQQLDDRWKLISWQSTRIPQD